MDSSVNVVASSLWAVRFFSTESRNEGQADDSPSPLTLLWPPFWDSESFPWSGQHIRITVQQWYTSLNTIWTHSFTNIYNIDDLNSCSLIWSCDEDCLRKYSGSACCCRCICCCCCCCCFCFVDFFIKFETKGATAEDIDEPVSLNE